MGTNYVAIGFYGDNRSVGFEGAEIMDAGELIKVMYHEGGKFHTKTFKKCDVFCVHTAADIEVENDECNFNAAEVTQSIPAGVALIHDELSYTTLHPITEPIVYADGKGRSIYIVNSAEIGELKKMIEVGNAHLIVPGDLLMVMDSYEALREKLERMELERNNCFESACTMGSSADYYRGLCEEIGNIFGDMAKTSDDGSVQQDIICLKVPGLVEELLLSHQNLLERNGELQRDVQRKALTTGDMSIANTPNHITAYQELLDQAIALANQYKSDYIGACETIAKMRAAAVGEVTGPKRGVVEDVEDLKSRLDGAVRDKNELASLVRAVKNFCNEQTQRI